MHIRLPYDMVEAHTKDNGYFKTINSWNSDLIQTELRRGDQSTSEQYEIRIFFFMKKNCKPTKDTSKNLKQTGTGPSNVTEVRIKMFSVIRD